MDHEADDRAARQIFDALDRDQHFADWQDASSAPRPEDLFEAARAVLSPDAPTYFAELERERLLRKLMLLQAVAPYFESTEDTWESVFARLSSTDREAVEEILGSDTLRDVLDPSPWNPAGPDKPS
jgi:hypothetical protein